MLQAADALARLLRDVPGGRQVSGPGQQGLPSTYYFDNADSGLCYTTQHLLQDPMALNGGLA